MNNRACAICRNRLATICEHCRARLTRQLATIPGLITDLYAHATYAHDGTTAEANDPISRALPAGPVPPISLQPRTTGGSVEAPAPIALDLIEVRPDLGPLYDWADRWREPTDRPVDDAITWLTEHLDRACDQHPEQVAVFATDLVTVIRRLRGQVGDRRQLIGHCPTEDCGTDLYVDTLDQAATCAGCGTTWPRKHWLWLADTLRSAA